MKKIALKDLIYKNYLKTSLTSLVLIEVFLIVLYFTVNNNLSKKNAQFIINDIEKDINTFIDLRYENVSKDFQNIEQNLNLVKTQQEEFFSNYDKIKVFRNVQLEKANNGIIYKKNKTGSSIAVSNKVNFTKSIENKINKTEKFDLMFKSIVDNNKNIIAAYFNSHDNINRYYPYIDNVYNVFTPSFDVRDYNFYSKANLVNNPKKDTVWTNVYLDPATKKWISSVITPIYKGGFLEGVTGFDVSVDNIVEQFLKIDLPYGASSFILNEQGRVIAMPEKIRELFKIDKVKLSYEKLEIKNTIYQPDDYNIFHKNNKTMKNNFRRILSDKPYFNKMKIDDETYFVFSKKLDKAPWYVISLVSKDKVLKSLNEIKNHYENLGYLVIAIITLFYMIFFIFLYYKAKYLVDIINKPILQIIDKTKSIGTTIKVEKLQNSNIKEIDELNENFNEMSKKLNQRTKKLVDSETKRVLLERDSKIDPLTKTYNRKYLDEFSKDYINKLDENSFVLSLLLIDLDDFKNINDTYGHDIGDEVIKKFIEYTKSVIREEDAIVRYGGDEFLIILSNSSLKEARIVAKKIINTVKEKNNTQYKFTVSIGCAQSNNKDKDLKDVIRRADESLYKAKESGKGKFI